MNILVTGAKGFIGKNLIAALKQQPDRQVLEFDVDNSLADSDRPGGAGRLGLPPRRGQSSP